jgi:hypothetical protein
MEIIQNQDEWLGKRGQFVDQQVDDVLELRGLISLEHAKRLSLNPGSEWREGCNQVLQKTDRIVVAAIQGEPG